MPILLIASLTLSQAAYTETIPKTAVKFKMVPVAGGTSTVGGKSTVVKPYFIAATEATWEMFDAFLTSGEPSKPYEQREFEPDAIARPSRSYILPDLGWGHQGYPVINVSITNVTMFCRWLSSVTGKKYRLPTEAEWDLAARAGATGPWKADADLVNKISWNLSNSDETTQPVGKKQPNAFGLYDMLGNVGEWTTDADGKPLLCGPTFRDPVTAVSPNVRRRYNIAWQETDPQVPKSRWWLSDGPFVGFRVVCEP
jgi:formylglycine-generating enzyme required for sulfatase activity